MTNSTIRSKCVLLSLSLTLTGALWNASAAHADETVCEEAFINSTAADPKWKQCMADARNYQQQGKSAQAANSWFRALTQAKKAQGNENDIQHMQACSNKMLAKIYIERGDYLKADGYLADAKAGYQKCSIVDPELDPIAKDLAKHYKTIPFDKLGDRVNSDLKEAGVTKISVFRKEDRDLIVIELLQKFIKPIKSEEVPKIAFAKKVSFEYFNRNNGEYQVSKIQGLTVLAKTLWVNLLESLLKVPDTTGAKAEVTAGKLGRTKTVVVNVPPDLYDPVKEILDNLRTQIQSDDTTGGAVASPSEASSNGTSSSDARSSDTGSTTTAATPTDTTASSAPGSDTVLDSQGTSSDAPSPTPDP